jgi:hypothetical protein
MTMLKMKKMWNRTERFLRAVWEGFMTGGTAKFK